VSELQKRLPAAVAAARSAIADEPQNWQTWLVLSRLQAEDGNAPGAVFALRRARSLNPQSPLF
jgi:cytochrome c-type biogenesis protein CcmH/NrfG